MLLQYKMDKIFTTLSIVVVAIPLICCIRITDNQPTTSSMPLLESTTKTYRISLPRPQRPSNRVPPHLQDIRTGYVDDDADDVIHIIEPPSYFQQLKRQAHRQQAFHSAQPQLTIDAPKKSTMDLFTQETQDIAQGVKATQTQKRKFATILPMHLVKFQQQQHHQQLQQKPQQPPQNAVPFELLASVRHKDRIFQRSRPLALPFARERIQVKNIQTILMEQGYEQQQYDRGQQLGYGVQRRTSGKYGLQNRQRVRRSAENLTNDHLEQESEGLKLNFSFEKNNNSSRKTTERETKGIQLPTGYLRRKREVPRNNLRTPKIRRSNTKKVGIDGKIMPTKNPNDTKRKLELTQKYALLKGNDLIDHITELLRNATQFTSDGLKLIKLPSSNKMTAATKALLQLGQKFQEDNSPTELIDEIQTKVNADVKLKEEQVNKILQQSVKTTDEIMVALLNYTKLAPEQCPENYSSTTIETNKRIQLIQSRINCIRQQISNDTKHLPTTLTKRGNKHFGERLTTTAATVAVNIHRRKQQDNKLTTKTPSTFLRANLQDQPDNENGRSIASNISANLLYDDIMTNIRNLLQIKNLEELNDEFDGNKKRDTSKANFGLDLPTRSIEDATTSPDFGEFKHLNEYLNELQKIVNDFIVTPSSESSTTTELILNSREYTNSFDTTTDPLKNWYIINNNGQIYQTKLANELRPTVSVFHRFPDIPKSEIYFQNRTLLTDKTKAYEIL